MLKFQYVDLATVVVVRALETLGHCRTCFPGSLKYKLNDLKRNANNHGLLESVRNFFDIVDTNYHRELQEKEPLQMFLNRVFLGSPGTG
jgi:hypothetical protein